MSRYVFAGLIVVCALATSLAEANILHQITGASRCDISITDKNCQNAWNRRDTGRRDCAIFEEQIVRGQLRYRRTKEKIIWKAEGGRCVQLRRAYLHLSCGGVGGNIINAATFSFDDVCKKIHVKNDRLVQ